MIRVTESYPKKLLKKFHLQGMQGCSELEVISYQTSILRIKKLLLRRKFKNKDVKVKIWKFKGSKPENSPRYLKTWPLKKIYTCKECEDELNLEKYLDKYSIF